MRQIYVTIPSLYLVVFVFPEKADMSLKPIPVIACVSFAVLRKLTKRRRYGSVMRQLFRSLCF